MAEHVQSPEEGEASHQRVRGRFASVSGGGSGSGGETAAPGDVRTVGAAQEGRGEGVTAAEAGVHAGAKMLPASDDGGGAVFINADFELETKDEAREPRQRKSAFTRGAPAEAASEVGAACGRDTLCT